MFTKIEKKKRRVKTENKRFILNRYKQKNQKVFQHFFKRLASMSSISLIFLCLSSAILLFWLACFKNSKFMGFSAFVAKRSASMHSTLILLANLNFFSFTALISAVKIFCLSDFCVSSFSALSYASSGWWLEWVPFYTPNHLVWNFNDFGALLWISLVVFNRSMSKRLSLQIFKKQLLVDAEASF